MPLGNIPWQNRLGIANIQAPNASSFAINVLGLPQNSPIYQGQLVHSLAWKEGPAMASAEWCGTEDNDYKHNCVLREVSAHDTVFARRNVRNTVRFPFEGHRSQYSNQLYYVNNEPEVGSVRSSGSSCGSDCWDIRDYSVDPAFQYVFPTPDPNVPNLSFWEASGGIEGNCAVDTNFKRIRADALSYIFLKLKRDTENLGRGHIVLPPSAVNAFYGIGTIDQYWIDFFNFIHKTGVTIGSHHEANISPNSLKALHFHHYSSDPLSVVQPFTPRDSVAGDSSVIRKGTDWYRTSYNSGNPINADVLLSENGFYWDIRDYRRWAGGWTNFLDGLAWWNSWLCWITRRGPYECNLKDWSTGAHTLHSCIHEPSQFPYTTNSAPNYARNQWCYNADTSQTGVWYDAPSYIVSQFPVVQTAKSIYQNSFTCSRAISWQARTWRNTPFGVCYTVWSKVGADPNSNNLNTGWVFNTAAGLVASTTVTLPAGWSTFYFPVIKDVGTFNANTQFLIKWIRSDGYICWQGAMSMTDFQDSYIYYNFNGLSEQRVYMAMIYPVVCYSSVQRNVTVEIHRNYSGAQAILGRPVGLPGACSWFIQ